MARGLTIVSMMLGAQRARRRRRARKLVQRTEMASGFPRKRG